MTTHRELFQNIMHYGSFDRMPVWHWTGWPETVERWHKEGLPRDVSQHEYFDALPMGCGIPVHAGLFPAFDEETIEETETYRVFRQDDGVIAKHFKGKSSIPTFIDFTLKNRKGWEEYKKRLQPDPGRIPEDIDRIIEDIKATGHPITIHTGSMVGIPRNWMGVENLAYLSADDPDLLAEIADTIAELVCWCMDQVLPKVKVDMGWGWEDICFRSGPLVSPKLFAKAMVPAYRKVSDKLLEYGCDLHLTDCDGKIDALIPHWLEGGVNVMFPVEIGVWKADPMAMRKQFGKDLRIVGGIDKLVLEKDRKAIDEEIERRKPLMAEGGCIPLPDHLMTPDTPLDNYKYYLDRIRNLRF